MSPCSLRVSCLLWVVCVGGCVADSTSDTPSGNSAIGGDFSAGADATSFFEACAQRPIDYYLETNSHNTASPRGDLTVKSWVRRTTDGLLQHQEVGAGLLAQITYVVFDNEADTRDVYVVRPNSMLCDGQRGLAHELPQGRTVELNPGQIAHFEYRFTGETRTLLGRTCRDIEARYVELDTTSLDCIDETSCAVLYHEDEANQNTAVQLDVGPLDDALVTLPTFCQ